MKPTPELINDWREKARQMAIQAAGYSDGVEHLRHFAELAAQWGAKQAQQTTEPLGFQIRRAIAAEDELRATKQTLEHAYAALQKVADAQAAIEEPELPEAVAWVKGLPEGTTHYSAGTPFNECGSAFDVVVRAFKYDDDGDLLVYRTDNDGEYGGWAKAESLFKVVPDTHHLHAFTAAQMHDHFAAGVRAGMGQSQDAKRYLWLRDDAARANIGVYFEAYSNRYRKWLEKEQLDAAIDAAMQGGQQP